MRILITEDDAVSRIIIAPRPLAEIASWPLKIEVSPEQERKLDNPPLIGQLPHALPLLTLLFLIYRTYAVARI
jgi:hypothetical protein